MSQDDRDDQIARALGSLPVPEHQPGFWERLDGALDQIDRENAPVNDDENRIEMPTPTRTPETPSAPVHDLDAARQSPRRAKVPRRYQMLSAAAAVALLIAGVGLLSSGGDGGSKEAPVADARLGDSEFDAVDAFQDALDSGPEALWPVLGPLTQARVGSQDNLDELFDGDNRMRPFELAPRSQWQAFPVAGEPKGAVVIAPIADDADSLVVPVVRVDGRWRVEYDATGSTGQPPVMVSRSARQPGEPIDIPIELSFDDGGELYGRIDGQGDFAQLEVAGNGLFRSTQKLSDLPAGDHTMEVVARGAGWFFVANVDLSGRTPPPVSPVNSYINVVRDWNQAIADGDADRAWELLGPLSRGYLSAQGGWEDMVADMAHGPYAGWAGQDDAPYTWLELPGGQAGVVFAAGTIKVDGKPDYAADAWPLAQAPTGKWEVELFAFGPGDTTAEWVNPQAGENGLSGIEPDATLEVLAPGKAYISLDGSQLETMTLDMRDRPGPQGRWTYKPAQPFSNGTHQVVVVTRGEGFFTASAVDFAVEG